MRRNLIRFIWLSCCIMVGLGLWAQTSVTGKVTDAGTGNPLAGTTVSIKGGSGSAVTKRFGILFNHRSIFGIALAVQPRWIPDL